MLKEFSARVGFVQRALALVFDCKRYVIVGSAAMHT